VVQKLDRCPFRVSRNKPWVVPLAGLDGLSKLARPSLPAGCILTEVGTWHHGHRRLGGWFGLYRFASGASRNRNRAGSCIFFRDTHRFARSVCSVRPEGWAARLDSSLGVHQRSPLHQYKHRESTPGRLRRADLRPGLPHPDAFRPCRSSRLRRFTPLDTLQVCCTLQPVMGFATFPGARADTRRHRLAPSIPVAQHPSKRSPLQQPSSVTPPRRVHRRSVPPRRCSRSCQRDVPCCHDVPQRRHRSLDLGALLHCRVRCSLPALPPTACPMLPWAWFPKRFVCEHRPAGDSEEPPGTAPCRCPEGRQPGVALQLAEAGWTGDTAHGRLPKETSVRGGLDLRLGPRLPREALRQR